MKILGFDPGRDKCGIALQEQTGKILYQAVIAAPEVARAIAQLLDAHHPDVVVLGNQTHCQIWLAQLRDLLPASIPIQPVDERNSSLEARDRSWQMYPPRGFTRLIPKGMRMPPRPIDDIVAILLIERYLSCLT
jgi:RNase H-fold protein (predicted Holliday junction resolvase)